MKHFLSIISLILAAAILSGCSGANESSNTTDTSSSSAVSSVAGTSSAIVSSTDSTSSAAPITSDDESSQPQRQIEPTEFEQVLKLIADYGVFMFDSFPPNRDNYDVVDKTKRIPVDHIPSYETSDGVASTIVLDESSINEKEWYNWAYKPIDSWTELLNSMTTEKMREEYVFIDDYYTLVHNGELYIRPTGGGRGVGLGMSYLRLDSVERPDENTYVLTVTSVGDKEEWGLQEDWLETEVVKVVKTAYGLRIDECSRKASEFFAWHQYIRYGDIEITIPTDYDLIKNLT